MSDRYLFFAVSGLIFIGVIFSLSLPVYHTQHVGLSQFHFFARQTLWAAIAFFVMWFLARQDPVRWVGRVGFFLFFFFFALMFIMPFLPHSIVPSINGARRWMRFEALSISPVEFFKVGFVYFLAWSLTRKIYKPKAGAKEQFSFARELGTLMPYGLIFIVTVFLIAVIQNDLGQVIILASTMALMIFFAGSSIKLFVSLIGVSFVAAIALIMQAQHRIERVTQWWSSVQDFVLSIFPDIVADALRVEAAPSDGAYQITQSLYAIHHGGLFGTGLGGGIVKLGFLSDVHNDFVLSGIAEEAGLAGVLLVSLLMLLAIYRIFKIANRSENPVFYLFSIGIGVMFGAQFLMNALGTTGLIPLKGITAPFLSYGGASLAASSIAVGLVLMISSKARI
ncbi:MAG: FtsW/RodA/SpoVE family cell cycle protein [Helicobacteraceae bacterium]|jgi:cell division protein FtsW|nr:FtsW/RodA/SpoVE family cell cycle protein [Helicobacteraceae bacterium]